MSQLRKIVTANVKRLRKESGLTQEQAAKRAGITAIHLSRIENSASNLTLDTIEAIAKAFDVDSSDLLTDGKSKDDKAIAKAKKALQRAAAAIHSQLKDLDK